MWNVYCVLLQRNFNHGKRLLWTCARVFNNVKRLLWMCARVFNNVKRLMWTPSVVWIIIFNMNLPYWLWPQQYELYNRMMSSLTLQWLLFTLWWTLLMTTRQPTPILTWSLRTLSTLNKTFHLLTLVIWTPANQGRWTFIVWNLTGIRDRDYIHKHFQYCEFTAF